MTAPVVIARAIGISRAAVPGLQRAADVAAAADRVVDEDAVAQHEAAAHQGVDDLSLERAALVDRIAGTRAHVGASERVLALEIDDREIRIEPDLERPLA